MGGDREVDSIETSYCRGLSYDHQSVALPRTPSHWCNWKESKIAMERTIKALCSPLTRIGPTISDQIDTGLGKYTLREFLREVEVTLEDVATACQDVDDEVS